MAEGDLPVALSQTLSHCLSVLGRHSSYLALPAILGAAMMGGLLFAFSNFAMRALSQLPPASGMEAMQRINVTIINPLFLGIFLGTGMLCVALIISSLHRGPFAGSGFLLAGAACYLAGVLGVTFLFNVPLNNMLATLGAADALQHWPPYVTSWLRWNHVRTVMAIASAGLMMIGHYADLT